MLRILAKALGRKDTMLEQEQDSKDSSLRLFMHSFFGKVLATVAAAGVISGVGLLLQVSSSVNLISNDLQHLSRQLDEAKEESRRWREDINARVKRIEERK